jgi:hypothetical protein
LFTEATGNAGGAPSVAVNDNNDVVVAYTVDFGGLTPAQEVFAHWFHNYAVPADGGTPIPVATGLDENESNAAVAVSPSGTGGFLVAFTSVSRPGFGNQASEVIVAGYDQNAVLLGRNLVAADGAGDFEPSIGMDNANNFVVAYTLGPPFVGPLAGPQQVYVRQFDAAGTPTSPAAEQITPPPQTNATSQNRPSVAVNPSGQVVAVAQDVGQGPGTVSVFAQAFKANSFWIQPQWPQFGSDGIPEVDLTNGQSLDVPVTIYRDVATMDMVNLGADNLPILKVSASQSSPAMPPPQVELRTVTFTAATILSSSETDACFLTATGPDGSVPIRIPFNIRLTPGFVSDVSLQGAPAGKIVKGTQVLIRGAGLVPGSQVQFGNSGWVTPDSIDATGQSIAVTVPADATDGYVTVRTPYGVSYVSPYQVFLDVGAITLIDKTGVSPQGLHPGSTVTVSGWGFTPGSTVSFGGSVPVTPVSLSETSLDVQVPRDAVDGPITVATANGTLTSTDTCRVTNFRNTNGFNYKNFAFDVSWQNVKDAFGLHWWDYANPVALGVWGIAAAALNGKGACFGMALLSERLSHGQEPINAAYGLPANASAATVFNLMRNGLQDSRNEALLVDQFSSEVVDYWLNWINQTQSAATIFDQIHAELQKGDQPLVSILDGVPIKDGLPNGHTLVAYDLSPKGANGAYTIHCYDCNRPFGSDDSGNPNDERTNASLHRMTENNCEIHVDDNGWNYLMASNLGTWSGGFDGGRLSVIPYSLVSGNFSLPNLSAIPAGFGWGAIGESRQAMFDQATALLNDSADLQKWLGPTDFNIQDVNWAQVKALLQTGPQDPITVGADGTVTVTGDKASSPDDTITLNVDANGGAMVTVNNDHWDFLPGTVKAITINPGLGNNVVNVLGTPAGVPVTITGGGGNDTYVVGSAAQTLDTIRGPLTINGGAGSSSLTLNDQGNPAVTTWNRTPGRIVQQRLEGPAVGTTEIDYANLPTPVINAGRGANTLTGNGPLERTFALGSTGTDHIANAVTTDGQGNFYLTGYFHGTVDFDPSSNVQALTSAGNYDGYVAKYSPTGGLIWVRQLVSSGSDSCDGYGVAVDGSGNVYVSGDFSGTATLGGTTLTNPTGYAGFAAKLDPAGTVLWARALALGNDGGDAYRLAPDGAGNVYAIGDFQGTVSFGGTTLTSAGGYDVYVAKLTSAGTVAWAKRLGGGGQDYVYGLALDRSGNVYVAGDFQGTAIFGTFSLTTTGSYGAFVARLDGSGTVKWARGLTGSGEVDGYGLALDGSGNVYVAGPFTGTAQFGASTLTSAGSYDVFVAKLSSAGAVQWGRRFGGSGWDVAGNALAVDGSGNVYVGGTFQGTSTFGTTTFTARGLYDGFLMELDGAGTVSWAKQLAGGDVGVWGLAVDGAGTLDAVAYFQGTADLDPGPGVFNVASSNPPTATYTAYDSFVLQLAQAGPLNFTGLAGVGSAAYRLRQSSGDLQIVDDATGQVLLSKALAYTTSVAIQAANGVNTTLTIDFSGGAFSLPVTFTGGTGNNTLVGPNASETWNLTGPNAGKFGTVSFTGVQNLVGGTASDVFKFGAKGSLSGSLSGGGGGDWLDYSGLTTPVTVNLQTGAATGVAGGAAGKVANIQDVHGGNGGNTLTGNAQGNILIGGTGNDRIIGGSGLSLLIGDKGSDTIIGGSGGDILIGGYTTYDTMTTANEKALMSILAEWQSADSYATRVSDLKNGGGLNGSAKLAFGTTVKDDLAADTLTGGAPVAAGLLDWFFQGLGDKLNGVEGGEQVN